MVLSMLVAHRIWEHHETGPLFSWELSRLLTENPFHTNTKVGILSSLILGPSRRADTKKSSLSTEEEGLPR